MIERRINTTASSTAKMVCYYRAIAHHEEELDFGPDYLADQFISPKNRAKILDPTQRILLIEAFPDKEIYPYFICRTKHMDRFYQAAIKNKIEQIVILGAGYDTRAYRFPTAPNSKVFEVDVDSTQNAKRKYLALSDIEIPENLSYLSINFNKQSLKDELLKVGFDSSKKTYFLWEGVTPYLDASAVTATLSFIKKYSAKGSQVAFDYIYDWVLQDELKNAVVKNSVAYVKSKGEPFTFGIPEDGILSFLSKNGFSVVGHWNQNQFANDYLDEKHGLPFSYFGNVIASTDL